MVARLLNLCGLDLGPEEEMLPPDSNNPAGYWENTAVVDLNDELLTALGGSWDVVPVTDDWATAPDLAALFRRAQAFAARFHGRSSWGWKDPRSSLTLPFWKRLLPGLRIVVCVRHPLEVMASLRRRGDAVAETGLDLWLDQYRRLLETLGPDDWLVTHYDAYLHDARAELGRVASWLGLEADDATLGRAVETVSDELRHQRVTPPESLEASAAPDVVDCYHALCAAAGPVLRVAHAARAWHPRSSVEPGRFIEGILRRRIATLEGRIAARDRELVACDRELAAREREIAESSARRVELAERVRALTAAADIRETTIASHAARVAALRHELLTVTHSRGWRLLERLWRLRLGLAPNGTRRERLWVGLAGRLGV
jgi:hypothetical protein